MTYLSLFTGAGGGDLACQHLLGWKCLGYVENGDYCQRIIRQRITDGFMHDAPQFGDIRAFIRDGYAASYKGMVDVVTGGFPCQPFSVAGKRRGADDERNMWPATIRTIREVGPRFAFLENVPGLLVHEYFGTILGDLAESGFDVRWRCLSAAELGAPHIRNRLWILAQSNSTRSRSSPRDTDNQRRPASQGRRAGLSSSTRRAARASVCDAGATGENVANSTSESCNSGDRQGSRAKQEPPGGFGSGNGRPWPVEPDVGRVAYGVPARVGKLRALGNAQVCRVAATAWRLLSEGERNDPNDAHVSQMRGRHGNALGGTDQGS